MEDGKKIVNIEELGIQTTEQLYRGLGKLYEKYPSEIPLLHADELSEDSNGLSWGMEIKRSEDGIHIEQFDSKFLSTPVKDIQLKVGDYNIFLSTNRPVEDQKNLHRDIKTGLSVIEKEYGYLDDEKSGVVITNYEKNEMNKNIVLTVTSLIAGLSLLNFVSNPRKTMEAVNVTGMSPNMIYFILIVVFFGASFLFLRKPFMEILRKR